MARLEAVLFLAKEPLGSRRIADLAGLADGTEARTLVRKLNRLYDEHSCAFRAEEVAGGFQLRTRPKFAPWLRRLQASQIEVRLSGPAMETLAVIAYRQPIVRADIEAVRGVQCGEILRQLMERDLVRIVGRSEELGRPLLYGTTRRFLQVFGLRHLEELPRLPKGSCPAPSAPQESSIASQKLGSGPEPSNQPIYSTKMEGELNVKTAADTGFVLQEPFEENAAMLVDPRPDVVLNAKDEDEDWEDEEDEDEEGDEDFDDYEDEEEEEELEEDEWEEVDDEDIEEEDLDEEDEDWDEDEDEDEDWDEDEDEDEDWDEDEEEDWE